MTKSDFIDYNTLNHLAHETKLLSEIRNIESELSETGNNFFYKLFMSYGSVGYCFDTLKEAMKTRRDFFIAMMEYWGPDQLIFTDGVDGEITIVAAVAGITDMFCKANRFSFSLLIEGVPHAVNLVFFDHDQAMKERKSIGDKLENYLQSLSMKKNQMAMVANG